MSNQTRDIGIRIAEKRKKLGKTQKLLSEMVGVTPAAINKFEKGVIIPSTAVLVKIANALKTNTDYLLTGSIQDEEKVNIAFREFSKLSDTDKHLIQNLIESLKKDS